MNYAIEILKDFKAEFLDRIPLIDYLRMNGLDTPIDYPEVKDILSGVTEDKDKASLLIECLQAKDDVGINRSHQKGAMKNYESVLYSAFIKRYGRNPILNKKDIIALCNGMGGIALNGKELKLRNNMDASVSRLKKLKLELEVEMEALYELYDKKRSAPAAEIALQDNDDDYEYYCDEFEKIWDDVKSNRNLLVGGYDVKQ